MTRIIHIITKRILTLLIISLLLANCSSLISDFSSGMANNLSSAMLNHNDLDTVKDAAPAYLLMIDGFLRDEPDNIALLTASARLYSAYAGVFVEDPMRVKRLSDRALSHALHAACIQNVELCSIRTMAFANLQPTLAKLNNEDINVLYTLGSSWAGWIQASTEDWNAVADLPRITAIMRRVIEMDESYQQGSAHLYLGISASLLPPTLGGKPEIAREHFKQAINLSAGKNLMAKVIYAQKYARLVFNRHLHDRLLEEVLDADPVAADLTLTNMLAKQLATELLASADDYF